MIEGLKPYAEYKESGHLWLGSVPNHWSVIPNRALFDEVKDRNHPKEEMLSVTITRGIVRQKALLDGSSKKDSSNLNKAAYKLVQPHDIAYNKMRAWQGALGASALRGIISPAYVVMRPRDEANPWFYHHLYRTPSFAKEAERWSYGITSDMWSLRPEHFKVIGSVLPPPDEQSAIVRFLDHANRKIDGFIRAKRKLIGLLNEQKQAIIHRAVTRGLSGVASAKTGLHPDVPLKPSGIPWLGDIPEHWEVRRAKYLFREVDDRSKEGKEIHLAMSQRLGLVPSSMVESAMRSESYAGAKLCREGDLVLNRLKAHLGVFALAKQGGVISPDYSVFRKRASISMEYYESVLKSSACRRELRIRAKGLVEGFWRLYTDDFYDIRLPVPPLVEQQEIMTAMTVETAALTTAIARTEREIALMQEYRTRLTADLVTGKLDVREAAASLPEVAAEPTAVEPAPDEPLEEIEAEETE